MENYIDFFCFKDPANNLVYFRFKKFMDYGNIEGIKQSFIHLDMLKNCFDALDTMSKFLLNGYVLSLPVHKMSIAFYGQSEGTHPLFVYGVDTDQQILLCKDFDGHQFVDFEVPFEAMKDSLANCEITNLQALKGLLAFRIDDKASIQIEYSKVYSEFYKLRGEYTSTNAGYGLGAIDLYVNGVIQYPCEVNPIDRWYVIANYLRESTKLMKMRFDILEKEIREKQIIKAVDRHFLKNLIRDVDILFFKILKLQQKKISSSSEIVEKLYEFTNICRKDFQMLAEYICEFVCDAMPLQ